MLAAAIANRRSLALELMQHDYNIQQQKLFTWASPEVLLSWTAVFWTALCMHPLLTGWPVRPLDMLLALDWLRPCPWLGASESESCKAMMTGDCKGGPTLVGLGETAKHHNIG